jgi:hypothetical protein
VRVRADDSGTDKGEADVLPILQPDNSKIITLNSPIENLNSKAQTRLGVPAGGGDKVFSDLVDAGGANYDGFVPTWYGQTPNTNDATQSTASNQPQIVNAGSVIQENNRPALKLNGNKYFDTNIGFSGNKTCYIVINPDFGPTKFAGIICSDKSANRIILQNKNDYLYQFYNSMLIIETEQYSGGVQSLITVTKNHTVATNKIFIDGSEANYGRRAAANSDVIANLQLFTRASNAESMVGTGQEIIIFGDDNLSERTGTEKNIDSFYNIPNF